MEKISRLVFFLIILNFFIKIFNLNHPEGYIFDEVYHAFTANAYRHNDPRGYEWWHQSPVKGTAYEWLHPPLSKLFMAGGIWLFGNNSFGWRVISSLFGTLVIALIFLLGKTLFNRKTAFIASFLLTFEGLTFVQSRIAMNDIFITCFILLACYFFLAYLKNPNKRRLFLTGLSLGLAISTKWTGVFLLPLFFLFLIIKFKKNLFVFIKKESFVLIFAFFVIPVMVYLLSYSQFFFQGHSLKQLFQLHQQTWWYQTKLEATHPYQSKAYTWPLMLKPVWFYVLYEPAQVANIYVLGNPLILWSGLIFLPYSLITAISQKNKQLGFVLLAYFIFWLPWIFSPRIMFFYHYLPAIPFLCLILAWFLEKGWRRKQNRFFIIWYLILVVSTFIFFYPHLTGILVPKNLEQFYYWLGSWK